MVKIGILALENCMKSSVTGPYDIFSVASFEWKRQHPDAPPHFFKPAIISDDGQPVICFNQTRITPDTATKDCGNLDIVFIPVIFGNIDPILFNKRLILWIKNQSQKGALICAACAGAFLAAETGLLDQRQATTHWFLSTDFQKRYPDVILKTEKMIVDEGDIVTAGGVTAYMDLSLYMVRRFGSADLSAALSRLLLIDPVRQSQAPYTAFDFNTTHQDKAVLKAQIRMEKHLAQRMSVEQLADLAGLGLRTFTRRFKKATGDTPLVYLQRLRISKARTLLETTDHTVSEITWATGYEDVSSFRRLFARTTGLSPAAYRKRFCLL